MANESNSSVVRVHKNTDFTIMSNHHLRNQKLSLKAIGLMSKILGLPCDWNYSIAGLVKICKEGETAVRAALHELIDERYVYLEKLPPNYSKSGRFEYVYHIYEIPYENIPDGLECPELFLNNYKLSSGKRYKSDYHTILNWVIERVSKDYPQLDKPPAQSLAYDVNVNPFDQFVR